jgi:DNA-directed RNA polymerase subunit RPC12/RpoP
MIETVTPTCSICGKPIESGFGHNAQPVNDGRCCDDCNARVVLPTRLKRLREAEREH